MTKVLLINLLLKTMNDDSNYSIPASKKQMIILNINRCSGTLMNKDDVL